MNAREAMVTEARRWIGTPYLHQGRVRGAGCDCGGLIGGVAIGAGIVESDWWEREFDGEFGAYGRHPAGGQLEHICRRFMREIQAAQAEPGDVLLMRFAGAPQHLAIAANYRHGGLSIIHALNANRAVVEHRLAPPWPSRVVACFRVHEVAA